LAGATLAHPSPARAASADFGYVYTAEVEQPGETELSLSTTDRRGKGQGHYAAQDYRIEVERGIADRLQLSFYADFAGHQVHSLAGDVEPVRRNFAFQGLDAELKYQISDPEERPLGFALYAEPGWSRLAKVSGERLTEYELELKAIIQKNFLADRLVWATNLTLEPEWERERDELGGIAGRRTEKELGVELSTGASYRVAPGWWLGAEGRYHSVYPDWTRGLHRENYAIYAGPTVHLATGEWAVTATYLPQLKGGPSAPGSSLEYHDHERRELRVKISREF
jgi:hypothetical protein